MAASECRLRRGEPRDIAAVRTRFEVDAYWSNKQIEDEALWRPLSHELSDDPCGSKDRMPREGNLPRRGEDPNPVSAAFRHEWCDKGRFREVGLGCKELHALFRKRPITQHNRELVAGVRPLGADINNEELCGHGALVLRRLTLKVTGAPRWRPRRRRYELGRPVE